MNKYKQRYKDVICLYGGFDWLIVYEKIWEKPEKTRVMMVEFKNI